MISARIFTVYVYSVVLCLRFNISVLLSFFQSIIVAQYICQALIIDMDIIIFDQLFYQIGLKKNNRFLQFDHKNRFSSCYSHVSYTLKPLFSISVGASSSVLLLPYVIPATTDCAFCIMGCELSVSAIDSYES